MERQPLNLVQRWMQSVITHPGGVAAGVSTDAAKLHLDVAVDDLEQVIKPSMSQTSIERLAVYANAYYARLIECLASEFPIFRHTVGDETFAEFAADYLRHCPSRSYTLNKLGERFPLYLDESKPPRSVGESEIGWADFLVDLARLERAFSEVFDGAGLEGQEPMSADKLLAMPPDRRPQIRLKMAPCLRLLPLRFPLNDFYTAAKRRRTPQHATARDVLDGHYAARFHCASVRIESRTILAP